MQIIRMPVHTSFVEISDYLGSHPGKQIQISDESSTRTYARINDEQGFMKAVKVLETGEVINAKYWRNA